MPDFSVLFRPEGLVSLVSLTVMEIVLGIDNIIFIAILSARVAPAQRSRVRRVGLALALILRIGLLMALSWLMSLTKPLFSLLGAPISGRGLVLLVGGLFLIAKATHELHSHEEGESGPGAEGGAPESKAAGFGPTLAQILALDIVFSLDSVITAVGMVPHVLIMVTAMVLAVGVMLLFANTISEFINRHPSMKVLALSFLLLIGVLLVADTFGKHIDKGYVYFAMAFSFGVELLNMRMRKKGQKKGQKKGRKPGKAHEQPAQPKNV